MITRISEGIFRYTIGTPDMFTPVKCLKPASRAENIAGRQDLSCPFIEEDIDCRIQQRGIRLSIPLASDEDLYGFGLMLKSFRQNGKKKKLRTNADPVADTGDTHAPVPFYASTAGYGVLVDTSRYATFYCGCTSVGKREVLIEIPASKGIDLYFFAGRDIRDAVARYNLFCGGGAYVPLWGLGIFYRAYGGSKQSDIENLARMLRADRMPCDVLGLEPGWQSRSYPCSFDWDPTNFPDHREMLRRLERQGFKVNLWEHAYIHPESPSYDAVRPHSGDYTVWNGLVPDFCLVEAREAFLKQQRLLQSEGVSGFKLDECDNSDFTEFWGFPECTEFPSGIDGEQMHTLFGSLYGTAMAEVFHEIGLRTYGQIRQLTACANSLPYALYSDLYNHEDFIRGLSSAAFSGILWSPEVRQVDSAEELIRRLQAVVCSPQAVLNCWMVPNPLWKQFRYQENLDGELLPEAEEMTVACRRILEFRMSLIPHLYAAFHQYHFAGLPPIRPLVMDYPDDLDARWIDDELIIGEGVLAAPVAYGSDNRKRIYLPEGTWYNYHTSERLEGKQWIERVISLDEIPLFVKEGTLLCMADPEMFVGRSTVFDLHLRAYGPGNCIAHLAVDDGTTDTYMTSPPVWVTLRYANHSLTMDGDVTSLYRVRSVQEIVSPPDKS
jgi:alpha-D-xyloside xylohydrolase